MSVVTAVTAQDTCTVRAVAPIDSGLVAQQMEAVFEDIGVDALKIGMLANAEIASTVADRLDALPPTPTVLDPVMLSKSGDRLLSQEAIDVLRTRLVPRALLVTPNLPEAEELTGMKVSTPEQQAQAARGLVAMGASAALVKGGHRTGEKVLDVLFDGRRFERFERPRLDTRSDHGTGCTLSSAIAVFVARDLPLAEAVRRGGDYLHGALKHAFPLGKGHGPVHHFYRQVHGGAGRG